MKTKKKIVSQDTKEKKPMQLWWWSCDSDENESSEDHGYFEDLGFSRIFVMARSKMGAAYHLCDSIHISYTERRIVLSMIRRMNSFRKGWGKFEAEVLAAVTPSEKGGVWGRVHGKWDTILPLDAEFEEGPRTAVRPKDNAPSDELLEKAARQERRKQHKRGYDADRRDRKRAEKLQLARAPRLQELRSKVQLVLDARWAAILSNEHARVAAEAVRRSMALHTPRTKDPREGLWEPEVLSYDNFVPWAIGPYRRHAA